MQPMGRRSLRHEGRREAEEEAHEHGEEHEGHRRRKCAPPPPPLRAPASLPVAAVLTNGEPSNMSPGSFIT